MKKLTGPILLAGSAVNCPDIEYITGFRAVDPVIVLQHRREQYLVVPQLEFGRAERITREKYSVKNSLHRHGPVIVLTARMLKVKPLKQGKLDEWALKLLNHQQLRTVQVASSFPHGIAQRLKQAGIRVTVAVGELFPERAIKTVRELRNIEESQQAAVISMRAAVAMIAGSETDDEGYLRIKGKHLTSEDVKFTVTKILHDHNCLCRELIIAGGPHTADPHEMGHGPLRAHELIVIDIFPQHQTHGYWGDLTRTIVRGSPSHKMKKMYHAVKAAQSAALNRVKPGVNYRTLHRCAVREFERRGFKTTVVEGKHVGFIHSTGHGVGLDIHEGPSIGTGDGRLKSGNVVTIEPGLYYPEVGGVRIEDTIVVSPGGWRYLVPCERKFEV